jgi:hypothetical protein
VQATADGLGQDSATYRKLFEPLAAHWDGLDRDVLAPCCALSRDNSRAFFVTTFAFFGTARWSSFRAVVAAVGVISFHDPIAILDKAITIFVGAILLRHFFSPPRKHKMN